MRSPGRPRVLSPTSSLIIISSSEDEADDSPVLLGGLSSQDILSPGMPTEVDKIDLESAPQQLYPPTQSTRLSRTRLRPDMPPDDVHSRLKPLASYMDGFTETARKAVQSQGKAEIELAQNSLHDARR